MNESTKRRQSVRGRVRDLVDEAVVAAAGPRIPAELADRDRAIAEALSGFADTKVIPLRRGLN